MNLILLLIIAESTFLEKFCLLPIILVAIILTIAGILKKIKKSKDEERLKIQREKERVEHEKWIIEQEKDNEERQIEEEKRDNDYERITGELLDLIKSGKLKNVEVNFKFDEDEEVIANVDIESVHIIRGHFQYDKQYDKLLITNKNLIFRGLKTLNININYINSIQEVSVVTYDDEYEDNNEYSNDYEDENSKSKKKNSYSENAVISSTVCKITYKSRNKYNEFMFLIGNPFLSDYRMFIDKNDFLTSYLKNSYTSNSIKILNELLNYYSSK